MVEIWLQGNTSCLHAESVHFSDTITIVHPHYDEIILNL